ncbi:MAG: phosphomannomutase/phosphoglucomutase [Bacteroidales bacterium]|nr:phosphomannomutase/phosphoglucomutase [Bacteroidales bacterium]
MNAFKAYDIRGVYNRDFNKEDVYKIGFFLPHLLKTKRILVGRDVRESSPEIFEYLCKGINDSGADVYDTGLATTPMIYWGTAQLGFDASVMITASHNPKQYNGLKVSASNALPVGYDSGLSDLEQMILSDEIVVSDKKGSIIPNDFREEYLAFQKANINDVSNLNIAVDVSNGMAGLFIRSILGNQPAYIFEDLDGTFPNHEANPLVPENIVDIQNLVNETKADIGVIFDGDADRVMFVDENARFISPDLIIALLANHFLKDKKQGVRVLQDIRTSKAVGEYIAKFNGEMHMWRVGRAYAALKLREIDGLFGGELAGHYYFKEFFYSDSGLMAASLVLNIVSEFKKKGIKLSEIIQEIEVYQNSGEINFKIEQKQEAMDAVIAHFKSLGKPDAFYDFDGYRIEYPDWWLNIRPSNTEPYLRFLAEAKTSELLTSIVSKSKEIIQSFK